MFLRSLATALPPRFWTQAEFWNSIRDANVLTGLKPRSQLLLEAVDLEFVTGNLLRSLPPSTKSEVPKK